MSDPALPELTDPLGLAGTPTDHDAVGFFGSVDASSAIRAGTSRAQIGSLTSAEIALDATAPVVADIDFTAEVRLGHGNLEAGRIFTGYVTEAVRDGDVIRLTCSGNPQLHDPLPGAFVGRAPLDSMYAIFRDAGMSEERIRIQHLNDLPIEIIEVISNVNGLQLLKPVRVGQVTFFPAGAAIAATVVLGNEPLVASFSGAEAYAVTYVTAKHLYDAEALGRARIEVAMAWMNVRLRYANAISPEGVIVRWSRDQIRQTAHRVIHLTGLTWQRAEASSQCRPALPEVDGRVPVVVRQ